MKNNITLFIKFGFAFAIIVSISGFVFNFEYGLDTKNDSAIIVNENFGIYSLEYLFFSKTRDQN